MDHESKAIGVLIDWYKGLDCYRHNLPARGSITAALHVLNRLCSEFNLDLSTHVARGGAQIIGLSGKVTNKLLVEFGEKRILSAIGGRSNRGVPGDIGKLLRLVEQLRLEEVSKPKRVATLKAMQRHIVEKWIPLYFAAKRVKSTFDQNFSTRSCVKAILENALATKKIGPVAEYLVGAKLALRFPNKNIRNKGFSEADAQGGYSGDFEVGSTTFHVTVAPMTELMEKCNQNLERGRRVYLLVPDSMVVGTRQNVDLQAAGRIAVESIESFVATNIDELSEFDGAQLKSGFRRLLEKYNERVDAVELDKSLLIEIPPNLS